jgi:hypothetical protein
MVSCDGLCLITQSLQQKRICTVKLRFKIISQLEQLLFERYIYLWLPLILLGSTFLVKFRQQNLKRRVTIGSD